MPWLIRAVIQSCLLMIPLVGILAAAHAEERTSDTPWWWDAKWWEQGTLEVPSNYAVDVRWLSYKNGDTEVTAMLARPKKRGKYPGILFQHGRRGLDELIQLKVRRLAARGFVVLAPEVFSGRFIDPYPIEHDYAVEDDVDKGLDFLLSRPDIKGKKVCLVSHTRGGYMTLKVAVTKGRQEKDVACYVSWYPHMQDPNAPEPLQVYSYAPEADGLKIPALIFIGEDEQYQRRRSIESAVNSLKAKGRPVQLIVYPGVGRGFDFRPDTVRTFADDLASKDANWRAAKFIRRHLR